MFNMLPNEAQDLFYNKLFPGKNMDDDLEEKMEYQIFVWKVTRSFVYKKIGFKKTGHIYFEVGSICKIQ